MSLVRSIFSSDGYLSQQEIAGFMTLNGNGAITVIGGAVQSAERLVTAGAVPFVRVTLRRNYSPTVSAVTFGIKGATFCQVQQDELVATVGPALSTNNQFDVRFFDAAGAAIEPPVGFKLSFKITNDRSR